MEIDAVITDESGVGEAALHYQKGGDTEYLLLEMPIDGVETHTTTIPAAREVITQTRVISCS